MSFWELGEIQKIHDAESGSTKKSWDANSAFENETDLQYFRDKLTDENITKAIEWLNKTDNSGVTRNAEMLQRLESIRWTLRTIQTQVRSGQAKLLEVTAENMDITYDDKFWDHHKTSWSYPGNYEFPKGGAFVQENINGRNVAVVWNKDQKTIHSIILNGVQYINTNGEYKSKEGKTISVAHDATNRKIEIRTPSLTAWVIERLSPIENLVAKLQKSIDSYAVTKGYESGAKLEPKDKYSLTGDYQITLHRKIRVDGTSTFGKPLVLDGIYLKDGNGKPKWEDMLVREIVGKIEEAVKPADVVSQASVTAATPAAAAPQAPAAAPTTAPASTSRPSVSGDRETRALQYNRDFLKWEGNNLKVLANKDPKVLPNDVLTGLKTYIDTPSSTNANSLQDLLKTNYKIETGARGSVGPLTLAAIQEVSKKFLEQQRAGQARESNESNNQNIINEISKFIDRRLQKWDVRTSMDNPFSQIILDQTAYSKKWDLQMWNGWFEKSEDVLQWKNRDDWRKLTLEAKEDIIRQANALWSTKTKPQANAPQKMEWAEREKWIMKKNIFNEAKTRFIDAILGNDERFEKEYIAKSRNVKKAPILDPFWKIVIPWTQGYSKDDLQMRDNSLFPTATENILTGSNLTNWRNLTQDERTEIITELNKDWNSRGQKKIDASKK